MFCGLLPPVIGGDFLRIPPCGVLVFHLFSTLFCVPALVALYRMQEACQPESEDQEKRDSLNFTGKTENRGVKVFLVNGKKSAHFPCTVCSVLPMSRPHRFFKPVRSYYKEEARSTNGRCTVKVVVSPVAQEIKP
ncbi:hypothetical protein U14_00645 [Candidatus Moduliflexus flocculans]|uniref:Uncharacterized protein n=1 Tax=Candidatus Moduliflexus flocculans TaxID=1499966 RepID=A0A0S6VUI0_9BACT|nr:hypothetical protein U14_00645 [Candidatus Moduliflexus flocculans]